MSVRLNLTDAEADALDRLFDAWLNTEEAWDIVPAIRRVRHKLNAASGHLAAPTTSTPTPDRAPEQEKR